MKQFTLYVDGACRGNPGLGGWGALVIDDASQKKHEYCGGELHTTNNRMELTAAIQGILACPSDSVLRIFTDSSYVHKGITQWIEGWKKKNWKGVKNPDLWQQLDQVCQNRSINWHWVKGHAGNAGNEHADQLANQGADNMTKKKATPSANIDNDDWLLSDPFGLDSIPTPQEEVPTIATEADALSAFIVQTPTTNPQHGQRFLILDTETTGFYYKENDRIIEVGALEMINRKLTGSSIHIYINPEKDVGESENIHGISNEFLKDKPVFAQIASALFDYLKGATIIAHNASFDMNFLDAEFERAGFARLSSVCQVIDSLQLAKQRHPGQKNSLDMLVKRYDIVVRDRTFHGALLDAEILADVYLAMTGGQVSLDIDQQPTLAQQDTPLERIDVANLVVIKPSAQEYQAHLDWLAQYQSKYQQAALFSQFEAK